MNEKLTSSELQRILGAYNDISTKKFWDDESARVLYADTDKNTVYDNLTPLETEEATIYYITDLMEYWAVI